MQIINYQGQPIEVTLVNYLSGTIPTSTVDVDGDEELFRDEAGRYYLRRKLGLRADYHEDRGEGNIPASGRTHVHRINVNAAILWATTRLNSETLDLRRDAAAAIDGRSTISPSHLVTIKLSPAQRRMFEQIADYEPTEELVDVIVRELGQHVALHLECYHGHDLEAARARWAREAKEAA